MQQRMIRPIVPKDAKMTNEMPQLTMLYTNANTHVQCLGWKHQRTPSGGVACMPTSNPGQHHAIAPAPSAGLSDTGREADCDLVGSVDEIERLGRHTSPLQDTKPDEAMCLVPGRGF